LDEEAAASFGAASFAKASEAVTNSTAAETAVELVTIRISSEPTASTCPTSPPSPTTRPATGDGISTVALSVITSASAWSSATASPGFTCQATSST